MTARVNPRITRHVLGHVRVLFFFFFEPQSHRCLAFEGKRGRIMHITAVKSGQTDTATVEKETFLIIIMCSAELEGE